MSVDAQRAETRAEKLERLMVLLDDWWSDGEPIHIVPDAPEYYAHQRTWKDVRTGEAPVCMFVVGVGESLSAALLDYMDNQDGTVPPPPPGWYKRDD